MFKITFDLFNHLFKTFIEFISMQINFQNKESENHILQFKVFKLCSILAKLTEIILRTFLNFFFEIFNKNYVLKT